MEQEGSENIVYVNRRETFWYHGIRSMNYFSYQYWWLILLLFISFLIFWFFLCFLPNTENSIKCNGNTVFNDHINSIRTALENCCDCPTSNNNTPSASRENCSVHFSGAVMGGEYVEGNIRAIYSVNNMSEYAREGPIQTITMVRVKLFANKLIKVFFQSVNELFIWL